MMQDLPEFKALDEHDDARRNAFAKFIKRQKEKLRERDFSDDGGSATSRRRKEPVREKERERDDDREPERSRHRGDREVESPRRERDRGDRDRYRDRDRHRERDRDDRKRGRGDEREREKPRRGSDAVAVDDRRRGSKREREEDGPPEPDHKAREDVKVRVLVSSVHVPCFLTRLCSAQGRRAMRRGCWAWTRPRKAKYEGQRVRCGVYTGEHAHACEAC